MTHSELITQTQRRLRRVDTLSVLAGKLAQVAIPDVKVDKEVTQQVVLGTQPGIYRVAVAVRDSHRPVCGESKQAVVQ
jgi:hypothetical protein